MESDVEFRRFIFTCSSTSYTWLQMLTVGPERSQFFFLRFRFIWCKVWINLSNYNRYFRLINEVPLIHKCHLPLKGVLINLFMRIPESKISVIFSSDYPFLKFIQNFLRLFLLFTNFLIYLFNLRLFFIGFSEEWKERETSVWDRNIDQLPTLCIQTRNQPVMLQPTELPCQGLSLIF